MKSFNHHLISQVRLLFILVEDFPIMSNFFKDLMTGLTSVSPLCFISSKTSIFFLVPSRFFSNIYGRFLSPLISVPSSSS